jgi:hypothetical protein
MPTSGLISVPEREAIANWVRNNFKKGEKKSVETTKYTFKNPDLKAIDINAEGFEFMEKIQGHWVGKTFLLGDNIPWFAFDFRAINTSEVHSIFEGGSMGNLFNTFFVAEYKGVKTIMLRNGGILGGIYRTSYFVLTKVSGNEYTFVDAFGGKEIMYVTVKFDGDLLNFKAYTSKLGQTKVSRHLDFKGKRSPSTDYLKAAKKFNFPSKTSIKSFQKGMPKPDWGNKYPTVTSASYLMQDDNSMSYEQMGQMAQDPIKITDLDNIAKLKMKFTRNDLSKGKDISVYFSSQPLTNNSGVIKSEYGYISEEAFNSVILFPSIDKKQDEFTFMYLHTGKCYITCVIDNNQDMTPSKGDFYSKSIEIDLKDVNNKTLIIDSINQTF